MRDAAHLPNDIAALKAMLLASEPPVIEAYCVSRAVNSPRNNVADLLAAVA